MFWTTYKIKTTKINKFPCESKLTDLAKKMQRQMKMQMHLEGTGALNLFNALQLDKTVFKPAQAITVIA